ncbi:MAG TPA: FAD-dependent monooxygenase [Actinomycetota bacterium]|nr:FAD-dependent monooxygenase [Actinomycetota bacterium]
MEAEERTQVLVVGGALTGLSSAVFLGVHGVRCVLMERHPDLLIHPRLRGLTPRAVEAYRQVGLEPAIRAASFATGEGYAWVPVRADTLAGEHTPAEESDDGEEAGEVSPASFAPIDQDKLEVLLRAKAEELGVDVRFSTELVSFQQDDDGVTAVLRDRRDGAERMVRVDWLIAADGADSPVRERLGIGTDGPGVLFHTVTAMIEADLRPALRGRRVSIAYLQQPRPFTILMAHDDVGRRWVFATGYAPEHGESIDDFTDQRVVGMVRAAAGLPDVAVTLRPQIPGTDLKVLGFSVGARVARRYRQGRVFLVGDAAKIVPPTGGLGGSTGILDAHNLAWKLAAVLSGRAGPALLDTYHAERHPVGLFTMQQALARFGARMAPGDGGQGPAPLDYQAIAFGYQYRSQAVVGALDDGAPPLPPEQLTGQPGTRAPYLVVTVADDGRQSSTIDLYGRRFVLLAGANGATWVKAADAISESLGVPLDAYRFGVELRAPQTAADGAGAHGIGPAGALLIRPDGFVAWRSTGAAADPTVELERALQAILSRRS